MRENIGKFRGKKTHLGEWHIGNLVKSPCGKCFIGWGRAMDDGECEDVQFFGLEVDPETVGEFTGVPCSKETILCEGDLVKARDGRLCEVVHDEQFAAFKLLAVHSRGGFRPYYALCSVDYLECVGNIHDNPELLSPAK